MSHIHLLADQGDKAGVSQLIANGVELNDPDGAGETPLHYAAIKGHSEVVVILISSGADPNIKSYRGTTPLHDAARHGKLDAVTCLVDSKADIEAKDGNNRIPLHHAVENGHLKIVNKLLETNAIAQINSLAKDGASPLHLAAARGHIPIIKVLIEKGARLDLRDHKGNAALSSIPLVEKKPIESPQLGQQQILANIKSLFDSANGRFSTEGDDTHAHSFSDVTFIVEGTRINGHRNIIAARCHRLGKLFHQDQMKDELEIRDIAALTFEEILEWLYTDDVHSLHTGEQDVVHLFKLFQSSERFHLRPLKAYCEALMAQNLSSSNVGSIWSELRKMTPVPVSLVQFCSHLIISHWNFVAGTKLGQEITRDEVVYLLDQLTVAEPKELPKEPVVKSSSRSSPKPARTKSATQQPVAVPTPTHPKSRAAAAAASIPHTPTTPAAVHTPSTSKETDMRMNDKNLRMAKGLLNGIMKHKNAWPFNQPVDPVALGIPDYFDVIQNPMDLSTIRSKLDKGSYHTILAFANDMRLVFNNAMRYNVNGSAVYNFAEALLKAFNSKYSGTQWERSSGGDSPPVASPTAASNNKKRKSYGSPSAHNGVPSPHTPPVREHHIKPDLATRGTPAPVKEHSSSVPSVKPPKPSPPQLMSFEDKKLLGEKMNALTEDQLTHMVTILNKNKPQSGEVCKELIAQNFPEVGQSSFGLLGENLPNGAPPPPPLPLPPFFFGNLTDPA